MYYLAGQIFPLARALLIFLQVSLALKDQILCAPRKDLGETQASLTISGAALFAVQPAGQSSSPASVSRYKSLRAAHSVSQTVNESVPEYILHP